MARKPKEQHFEVVESFPTKEQVAIWKKESLEHLGHLRYIVNSVTLLEAEVEITNYYANRRTCD